MGPPHLSAAAPHPLHQFPLRRAKVSHAWCRPPVAGAELLVDEEEDNEEDEWLRCEAATTFQRQTAGLCTFDALKRNFRRFEGGGLFTNPGEERAAAARSLRVFDTNQEEEEEEEEACWIVVPKARLRELVSLESRLREERVALATQCRRAAPTCASLAVPSVAATTAFVSACSQTMRRCEVALAQVMSASSRTTEDASKLWRTNGGGRRRRVLEDEMKAARLAVVTGRWDEFRNRQEKLRRAKERERMEAEDARSRIIERWRWTVQQRDDYKVYCGLVALYGVPFDEETFARLCPRAGARFEAMCEAAARGFQRMWRVRAPAYRRRRYFAARRIQTVRRGRAARARWTPVLHLRAECGVARPRRRAFVHWRQCVERTVRVRDLMRRAKYGRSAVVTLEWRKIVGEEKTEAAADRALSVVVAEVIERYVSKIADEWARSKERIEEDLAARAVDDVLDEIAGRFCIENAAFEIGWPEWMDSAWFLRHGTYEHHLALCAAGVLPASVFDYERRRVAESAAATSVQRVARGEFARSRLRPRVARLYRKKFDGAAYYYLNVATNRHQYHRPRLVSRLFPRSTF